jgi:hypothetical protein
MLGDAKVIVEQGTSRISYATAGNFIDRFTAGDKLIIYSSTTGGTTQGILWNNGNTTHSSSTGNFTIAAGSEVTVTVIDIPSGQQIANMRVRA